MLKDELTPVSLGFLRICIYGLWFLIVLLCPMQQYAMLPLEMFSPWGAFRHIPSVFYEWLLQPGSLLLYKSVLLGLLAACMLGVRPFPAVAIPAALMLLLFDGLMKGFNGFINHAQFGLLYATFLLVLFPCCADRLSVIRSSRDRVRPYHEYAMGYLSVVLLLCIAYALVGGRRLAAGGLEVFTGDAIVVYLSVQSVHYSPYPFDFGLLAGKNTFFMMFFQFGFLVTTIFEFLSPLVLVWKWFRVLWLLVIIPFHLMTLFTMNIFFWENMVLALVTIGGLCAYVSRCECFSSGGRNEDIGNE
ncbi:MAG: hypothetical protein JJU11_11410 [Candidatus Sumerlaeia bacterium]|nr:hypothetical protein [Candidatus Sumerlaeia bacterium]